MPYNWLYIRGVRERNRDSLLNYRVKVINVSAEGSILVCALYAWYIIYFDKKRGRVGLVIPLDDGHTVLLQIFSPDARVHVTRLRGHAYHGHIDEIEHEAVPRARA